MSEPCKPVKSFFGLRSRHTHDLHYNLLNMKNERVCSKCGFYQVRTRELGEKEGTYKNRGYIKDPNMLIQEWYYLYDERDTRPMLQYSEEERKKAEKEMGEKIGNMAYLMGVNAHVGFECDVKYSVHTSKLGAFVWIILVPSLWISLAFVIDHIVSYINTEYRLFSFLIIPFGCYYLFEVIRTEPWGVVVFTPEWVKKQNIHLVNRKTD